MVVSLFSLCSVAAAAANNCFVDEVWKADEIVVTSDLQYGEAYNALTKTTEKLLLDLYTPPASDTRKLRPAMVLIHGGAFVGGDKTSDGIPDLAKALAQRGYVAVSIDYRITGSYWGTKKYFPVTGGDCCPGTKSDQYAIDAAEDGKAAVRYVRKMAAEANVDPTRIGIAGDSAGAVTVLFMGYVDKAGEGKSGNPGYPSSASVVVPISGELYYEAFCKGISGGVPYGCKTGDWNYTNDINPRAHPQQPPLALVHGTADTTVPYREALMLQARANETGLPNTLITVPGGGHVPMQQLLESHMGQLAPFMVQAMNLGDAECPKKQR